MKLNIAIISLVVAGLHATSPQAQEATAIDSAKFDRQMKMAWKSGHRETIVTHLLAKETGLNVIGEVCFDRRIGTSVGQLAVEYARWMHPRDPSDQSETRQKFGKWLSDHRDRNFAWAQKGREDCPGLPEKLLADDLTRTQNQSAAFMAQPPYRKASQAEITKIMGDERH